LDLVHSLLPICKIKDALIFKWEYLFDNAARSRSEELVEYLLNYVPKNELRNILRYQSNYNPWYVAARNGLEGIIRLLIASGESYPLVRHKTRYCQRSPLHAAIAQGSETMASMLLDHGADIEEISVEISTAKCSPLHTSVFAKSSWLVTLLLDRGANIQSKMAYGDSALHIAARMGLEDIAELLVDRGGDLHAQSVRSERPLDTASRKGHKGVVTLLLRRGAQLSHVGAKFSPLHAAVREISASKDVVKFLIEEGLEVDLRTTDGETPLYLALDYAPEDVIELLIALGADPNKRSKGNQTPLESLLRGASRKRDARVFRIIQLLGERTDAETKNLQLRIVVQERSNNLAVCENLVDALISIGADVNAQHNGGKTLLFFVYYRYLEATVKLLLERGVSASAVDDDGNTMFHHLANGFKSLSPSIQAKYKTEYALTVKLISAAGADLNAMNHNSERAVDVLRAQGIEIPPEGSILSD